MRRQAEGHTRARRRPGAPALAALLFAVSLLASAGVAGAQDLAERIDESYRVLPTRQGLLLEPRDEVPGIQTIEIAAGEVAINGEPVAPTILRSWLGEEAAPLLELAALPEDEARALFAPAARGAGAEAEEADAEEEPAEELADELGTAAEEPAPLVEEPDPLTADDETKIFLGERVIFGRTLTIDEDEVAGEVVVIGGAVHVLGRVDGGVVAVGGPVILEGVVRGEVVSVGGGVELGPQAEIRGGVVSVGGTVRGRDDQIGGDVVQVSFPWAWDGDFGWEPRWGRQGSPVRAWAAREAVGNLAVILLLGLMVAFLLLVARGAVERAASAIARQPGSALLSGFAMWIFQLVGIFVVVIILALTIVGCFAIPLVPVVWLFGWLLYLPGYAAAALATGRWLGGRFGWSMGGAYGTALAGVLVIEVVKLVGNFLAIAGGPFVVLATLVEIAGLLIVLAAWTIGVGAVLMNLLNRRRRPTQPVPPGPLPPLPTGGEGGGWGGAGFASAPAGTTGLAGPAAEHSPAPAAAPAPPVDPGPVGGGPATPTAEPWTAPEPPAEEGPAGEPPAPPPDRGGKDG